MEHKRVVITLVVLVLVVVVIVIVAGRGWNGGTSDINGTSVAVLIDFSKSFAASRSPEGAPVYGLRQEDARALRQIVDAAAMMASQHWRPPIKFVWFPIVTASITALPLCQSMEVNPRLIQPDGTVGTQHQIDSALSVCLEVVLASSRDITKLSDYTDISSSIGNVTEREQGLNSKRVLFILSDFYQELPRTARELSFILSGEQVVLLHRPGINEPLNVLAYLERLQEWKVKLLENGASEVHGLYVPAVTKSRLLSMLEPRGASAGTDLAIVCDLKDDVCSAVGGKAAYQQLLVKLVQSLSRMARYWPSPVTVRLQAVGETGFDSYAMPPVVFNPILIKGSSSLSTGDDLVVETVDELVVALEEMAIGLPNVRNHNNEAGDISGSLALACSISPHPDTSIVVILSDFVEKDMTSAAHLHFTAATNVIMLHVPCPGDESDPNRYRARRDNWVAYLKAAGAYAVHQVAVRSFTESDLEACFSSEHK